jgi:hypothetical protein
MLPRPAPAIDAHHHVDSLLPLALWIGLVTGFAERAKIAVELVIPQCAFGRSRDAGG